MPAIVDRVNLIGAFNLMLELILAIGNILAEYLRSANLSLLLSARDLLRLRATENSACKRVEICHRRSTLRGRRGPLKINRQDYIKS